MEALSWDELESLRALHGEGYYLLEPARFAANLGNFAGAFCRFYPRTSVGWSFKTSWLPPIVRAAMRAGAYSEVVSRHEYELALRLGAAPERILFNGPVKSKADLGVALHAGARVHLDGPDEVADVLALAAANPGRNYRVGLRCNVDIGLAHRGRFGIDAESGALRDAFEALEARPNVAVAGLHLHVSGAREAESYRRRARRMIGLADTLFGDRVPDYIDLGGGFCGPIPESLARQMPYAPPSYEDYAEAIAPLFAERWPAGGPELVLEPGIALVADAMRYVARVASIKTIGGQRHAIVSGSIYTIKPTLHGFDMPFQLVRRNPGKPPREGRTIVSGYTCMEIDQLHRACPVELERGDFLVFDNCGAYTFVLNPRFIVGTPAVVSRTAAGWAVVRAADTVDSWLASFSGEQA